MSNGIRTQNYLVCKQTLEPNLPNDWAVRIGTTCWLCVFIVSHTDFRVSLHSLMKWWVWLIGWMFIYKISGCAFKSRCIHLKKKQCVYKQMKHVLGLFSEKGNLSLSHTIKGLFTSPFKRCFKLISFNVFLFEKNKTNIFRKECSWRLYLVSFVCLSNFIFVYSV